jgi:hypothetical protein
VAAEVHEEDLPGGEALYEAAREGGEVATRAEDAVDEDGGRRARGCRGAAVADERALRF